MAVLDLARGAVVVRIVYDGAPYAGKTSSLRALARSLGSRVETPMELAERTVYFDWLEYTGGLYEGYRIHCQILSVPGQRSLEARRRALLELADAVVYVLDSSTEEAARLGAELLGSTKGALSQRPGGPVGIVLQANKRDRDGALSRETLRGLLGADAAEVAITEASAEEGFGVRETFVFAVRLAIDRLRLQTEGRGLAPGTPDFTSPRELMAKLAPGVELDEGLQGQLAAPRMDPPALVVDDAPASAAESKTLPVGAAAPKEAPAPAEESRASAPMISEPRRRGSTSPNSSALAVPSVPAAPSPSVASGTIWPPVEGRVILHEIAALGPTMRQDACGVWTAAAGTEWLLASAPSQEFRSFEAGRQELLLWAREHALLQHALSPHRTVVLAETGLGTWRMWQIRRRGTSLRDSVLAVCDGPLPGLYARLLEVAATLAEACQRCARTRLRPTLDSYGPGVGRFGGVFVGPVPALREPVAEPVTDPPTWISMQLAALLMTDLAPRCRELTSKAVEPGPGREPWDAVVRSAIASAASASAPR